MKELLKQAWESGYNSHHDCKSETQKENDLNDFLDIVDDQINKPEMIINRIDELINQNMDILKLSKEGIETSEDQKEYDLLEQRLLGGNAAFLEIRRLI